MVMKGADADGVRDSFEKLMNATNGQPRAKFEVVHSFDGGHIQKGCTVLAPGEETGFHKTHLHRQLLWGEKTSGCRARLSVVGSSSGSVL